jgi:two-component system, LuxR family, sensor kinase FixL
VLGTGVKSVSAQPIIETRATVLTKPFKCKVPALTPLLVTGGVLTCATVASQWWLSQLGISASAVATFSGVIGGGSLIVFGVSFVFWYRNCQRRVQDMLLYWEGDTRKLTDTIQTLQKSQVERHDLTQELTKLKAELDRRVQEKTKELNLACDKLRAELNERKQAEKALAQQAQELGRSKDVLELHVQARTQELQKLQKRNESILNSAGEGIYGLDLQGRTTFVNPAAAKLTGWKVEELIGKPESEVFCKPPEGPAVGQMSHPGEQVFFRRDGSTFPVEYVRSPIMEKDRLVGAVVMFKDITERKRTHDALARKAAELARSNAELEQFAYVASHDLQEPLRKIQAFGDRLKGKLDALGIQEGREFLERMQNAAARMQRLINDLLTFSRVISSKSDQPFVAVSLGQVAKEVLSDLEVRIEQTKAHIDVSDLPTIQADPMQMRQLLQNLIGNALKFQAPNSKPQIQIQAHTLRRPFNGEASGGPEQELCEISIKDNGIGFDEKYTEKIFAMFQRLHGRNEYEGTGVGLAVCRRIADRHGGTISAKGKPGEGATFTVTLPVTHGNQEN